MSFILDALRKSENERQRGAVPDIAHVPFAAPRYRLPAWALTLIVLLSVSVVGLGGAWWQSSRSEQRAESAASAPVANVPLDIPAPSPSRQSRPAAVAAQRPDISATRPLEALTERPGTSAATPASERVAAAEIPAAEATSAPEAGAMSSAWQTLPTVATLAAEGIALPPLRLELHVFYRDRPADRLVIINGRRYHERDVIEEGPRVVAIEPAGAVLSYQGREFTLSPE